MSRLLLIATAIGIGLGGPVLAFHQKGVANCNGCHLTHGEGVEGGMLVGPSADEGLLIAESASDVCLVCHAESLGAVLGADQTDIASRSSERRRARTSPPASAGGRAPGSSSRSAPRRHGPSACRSPPPAPCRTFPQRWRERRSGRRRFRWRNSWRPWSPASRA